MQVAEVPKRGDDYRAKGMKTLTTWVDKDIILALKYLSLEKHSTIQELVGEFLRDGLAKHGKKVKKP